MSWNVSLPDRIGKELRRYPVLIRKKVIYPKLFFDFGSERHLYTQVPYEKVWQIKKQLKILDHYEEKETLTEKKPWQHAFRDLFDEIGGEPAFREAALAVKTCRQEKKMTQKKLASLLKVEQGYISKMERAKIPIGKKIAYRLQSLFKINYKVFLSDLPI